MNLTHYLAAARRNLTSRKGANFLNILGLSIGLAGCLVIFLIEQHEWSYDRYHKNAARIYQVVKNTKTPQGDEFHVSVPFQMTRALRQDYPQIRFTEIYTSYGSQVTVPAISAAGPSTSAGPSTPAARTASPDRKFVEETGLFYAEPALFDLFDVEWLSGDARVLEQPNMVVLCQSLAEKYFGQWDHAIGHTILLDNAITARVAAIIADPPVNTDFPFRAVVSYKTFLANSGAFGFSNLSGWGWSVSSHQIYALLPENANAAAIDKSLPAFVAKYYQGDQTSKKIYFLNPLSAIHFDTRFDNNGDHVSSKASLYALDFIGLLIILMACINFVNLSTALAATRAREVGIRKVMGSSRVQLAGQVLADTGLIILLSLGLALLLAQLSLPYVRYISPIDTPLHLFNKGTALFVMVILVITTLLSGVYPALQLSRFNPIEAIRNKFTAAQAGGYNLRRILVVLQFSFSQILIIATLIAVSQMDYIRNADLGFIKESVLLLQGNTDSAFLARERSFKRELLSRPDVRAVSFSENTPSQGQHAANFGFDRIETDQPFYADLKFGDIDYAKAYGLTMAAGRWYTTDDTTGEAVINETMAQKLGIPDPGQAIGKEIRVGSSGSRWRRIIGVVKDFKNFSLKQAVPPNIIIRNRGNSSLTGIRLNSNNLGRSSREIETIWNKYYPEYAFNPSFLDERIESNYRQEQRLSASFKIYTLLAILISSLGLYGLVSFLVVQKTKEVGIRKVLGASIGNIIYLFSREFTILISIAFLIAAPVAYYIMHGWLQDFVYRTRIGGGVFLLAVLTSLGLSWITVGYKSVRAALVNPAESLKAE
jgi:ABC-type antimicrobial peptide transport system permease subunit